MFNIGVNGTYTAFLYSSASNTQLGSATSIPLQFYTGDVERMRITSGGTVCINSTSQGSNEALRVRTTGTDEWVVLMNSVNRGWLNEQSSASGGIAAYFNVNNGTNVGQISTTSSSTSYVTSSDYRLKENVAPMTGALAKVSQLKPCTYTWKADGKDGQGFIAHELQAVIPDAVTGEKDAVEIYTDEDGNEQTRIKPQGIDTSFLVATLTAAIQELNAKVEAQAVRIAELEGAK
jgi:hypothetical protein